MASDSVSLLTQRQAVLLDPAGDYMTEIEGGCMHGKGASHKISLGRAACFNRTAATLRRTTDRDTNIHTHTPSQSSHRMSSHTNTNTTVDANTMSSYSHSYHLLLVLRLTTMELSFGNQATWFHRPKSLNSEALRLTELALTRRQLCDGMAMCLSRLGIWGFRDMGFSA